MAGARLDIENYTKIEKADQSMTKEQIKNDIWYLYFERLWDISEIAQRYKSIMTYSEVRSIIFERLK